MTETDHRSPDDSMSMSFDQLIEELRRLRARNQELERAAVEPGLGAGREGKLLSAVFHAVGALTLILDADGKIGGANGAAAGLGFEPGALEGRFFWEALLVGDEATEAEADFVRLAKGYRPHHRDGKWRNAAGAELNVKWSFRPVYDDEGKLELAVVAGLDLTDRMKTSSMLRETQSRYTELLDNLRDYVYTLSPTGELTSLNPAFEQITGWKRSEWLGKHYVGLVHPDDRGRSDASFAKALQEDQPPRNEVRIRKKDGGYVTMEFSGRPLIVDGEVVGVSGIARDITDRVKTEEALIRAKQRAEEANRLKDQFLSMVSHDLRSPLGGVIGLLRFIDNGMIDPTAAEGKSLIARALSTLQNLVGMVEKLLNLGRLQSGRVTLQPTFTPLAGVVATVFDDLRAVAESKGIELVNDLPGDRRAFVDMELVTQVFSNLVSNAIKFCGDGDTIRVFVPAGTTDTIGVADTGPGVAAAMLPHLFDQTKKTSSKGSRGETGSGLGLPLSADLMKAHGGSVRVESTEGEGTTFYLSFPVQGPGVALVSRSSSFLDVARKALERLDGVTATPMTKGELLASLAAWRTHVVVVEAAGERESGFAFIEDLRETDAGQTVPVVLMTGTPDGDTARRAEVMERVRICFRLDDGANLREAVHELLG
jgi:PAS domain S-box-containing protein